MLAHTPPGGTVAQAVPGLTSGVYLILATVGLFVALAVVGLSTDRRNTTGRRAEVYAAAEAELLDRAA